MGLHLQDEVQFVASLGSIKANCMKLKKATIHQRYQQVLSVEPVWPLVPQMRSPCACAACLLSTPQALSFGGVIDNQALRVWSSVLSLGISPIAREKCAAVAVPQQKSVFG